MGSLKRILDGIEIGIIGHHASFGRPFVVRHRGCRVGPPLAAYLPLRASRRPSSVNAALRSNGLTPHSLENDPSALNGPGDGRR